LPADRIGAAEFREWRVFVFARIVRAWLSLPPAIARESCRAANWPGYGEAESRPGDHFCAWRCISGLLTLASEDGHRGFAVAAIEQVLRGFEQDSAEPYRESARSADRAWSRDSLASTRVSTALKLPLVARDEFFAGARRE